MNYEAAIFKLAKQRGYDPTDPLPPEVYHKLRLDVRSAAAIARDGTRMLVARAKSSLRIAVVPSQKQEANLGICRLNKCGSYGKLADGTEVCHRCTCDGKDLLNKTEQNNEHCPATNPETGEFYWDNRDAL